MPTPAERRRAKHRAERAQIVEGAGELRAHGQAGDGFAGLDQDAADATAALIEVIAGGPVENIRTRDWEHTRRVAEAILRPVGEAEAAGPLPAGSRTR